MRILVIAEDDKHVVRPGSLSALAFANSIAEQTGGEVLMLVLGHEVAQVAKHGANYAPVLAVDSPALAKPVADIYGTLIAKVVKDHGFDMIVAACTTFAKDIVARAAGMLGGAMAGDVVGHTWKRTLLLKRPMYAGAVVATVRLIGEPKFVTIRPSAYAPAESKPAAFEVTGVAVEEALLHSQIVVEGWESKATARPDVTEARVVVSGGRAIKSNEDFERLVGGLADRLGGAAGSSRALVDAGITPNELQVGQTGKIVAPDLYIALGISGAVQHLAGMKNSKTIVAINRDPDAPIFEVADYGLVGDVYQIVPEMLEKLGPVGKTINS